MTPRSRPARGPTCSSASTASRRILAQIAARDTSLLALLDAGCQARPGCPADAPRLAPGVGRRARPRGPRRSPGSQPVAPVVPPELAAKQVTPAAVPARARRQPFPRPGPVEGEPARLRRAVAELGAAGPAVPRLRAGLGWRGRDDGAAAQAAHRPHLPTRLAAHGAPVPLPSERCSRGTGPSCSPTSPASARRRSRCMAASVANAYPMLAVVPNVVKINWAREVERWTPQRRVTVIHGDGEDVDAFADVFVVNYAILDRHYRLAVARSGSGRWSSTRRTSSRTSSHSGRSRSSPSPTGSETTTPGGNPLLLALTGTPLINDVKDFDAIWRFLGWIKDGKPVAEHRPAARRDRLHTGGPRRSIRRPDSAVIDMGIVRRRKVDVASDLPDKRIADITVELDERPAGPSERAERALGERLARRYRALLRRGARSRDRRRAGRRPDAPRRGGRSSRPPSGEGTGENVFTLVRRIGQAKATLAADYAAQLSHSVGKVVFFAKHIDVMDDGRAGARARRGCAPFRSEATRPPSSDRKRSTPSRRIRRSPSRSARCWPPASVSTCTPRPTSCSPSCRGPRPSSSRPSTACTASGRTSRSRRGGSSPPGTIDTKIAELIDAKQGLAARALDGSDVEVGPRRHRPARRARRPCCAKP